MSKDSVGRKQTSRNEDWVSLWETCTEQISIEHMLELERKTILQARSFIQGNGYKRMAYGYSGGKDSVALRHLLGKAQIPIAGVFCALHHNEYPAFLEWLHKNAPKETEFIQLKRLSLEEINENENYLFPTGKKERDYYTAQWREAEADFVIKNGIDLVFAGRRIADGNTCGKRDSYGVLTSRNKVVTSCNVIGMWTHSELLAYIKYNQLELPPIYDYPNGWVYGTHPWTERDRVNNSIFETFDEIMTIDPNIVNEAAKTLNIAKQYLKARKEYAD